MECQWPLGAIRKDRGGEKCPEKLDRRVHALVDGLIGCGRRTGCSEANHPRLVDEEEAVPRHAGRLWVGFQREAEASRGNEVLEVVTRLRSGAELTINEPLRAEIRKRRRENAETTSILFLHRGDSPQTRYRRTLVGNSTSLLQIRNRDSCDDSDDGDDDHEFDKCETLLSIGHDSPRLLGATGLTAKKWGETLDRSLPECFKRS